MTRATTLCCAALALLAGCATPGAPAGKVAVFRGATVSSVAVAPPLGCSAADGSRGGCASDELRAALLRALSEQGVRTVAAEDADLHAAATVEAARAAALLFPRRPLPPARETCVVEHVPARDDDLPDAQLAAAGAIARKAGAGAVLLAVLHEERRRAAALDPLAGTSIETAPANAAGAALASIALLAAAPPRRASVVRAALVTREGRVVWRATAALKTAAFDDPAAALCLARQLAARLPLR